MEVLLTACRWYVRRRQSINLTVRDLAAANARAPGRAACGAALASAPLAADRVADPRLARLEDELFALHSACDAGMATPDAARAETPSTRGAVVDDDIVFVSPKAVNYAASTARSARKAPRTAPQQRWRAEKPLEALTTDEVAVALLSKYA